MHTCSANYIRISFILICKRKFTQCFFLVEGIANAVLAFLSAKALKAIKSARNCMKFLVILFTYSSKLACRFQNVVDLT